MPIYEYKCDQCDHRMEMLHKINETPDKTCPECGEEALRKLISAVAFKLKGTGWYETDFKDKKPKKEGKSDEKSTDSKKNESKKSSASETKKSTNTDKKTTKSSTSSSGSG